MASQPNPSSPREDSVSFPHVCPHGHRTRVTVTRGDAKALLAAVPAALYCPVCGAATPLEGEWAGLIARFAARP